jgi:uncharacterized protein YecE (DUF72 family)
MTSTRIGCSGWNYDDWRGRLYPPGVPKRRWLEVYAEHFDTVEVNTTFYRLPKRAAVAAWADQTPNGFEFTVKASRNLTHIKRLTDVGEGVRRFYERIEPLGEAGKLGPVLWQLPANFHTRRRAARGVARGAAAGTSHDRVPSSQLVRARGDGRPACGRCGAGDRRPSRAGV